MREEGHQAPTSQRPNAGESRGKGEWRSKQYRIHWAVERMCVCVCVLNDVGDRINGIGLETMVVQSLLPSCIRLRSRCGIFREQEKEDGKEKERGLQV